LTRTREPARSDSAYITPDGRYRYHLRRQLADDPTAPAMVFIMLNPSTADATTDDATIRRCKGFAEREGYGALEVVNLFAWRATDPQELRTVPDPVGPDNDRHILAAATRAGTVVAGWGAYVLSLGMVGAERVGWVAGKLERAGVQLCCLGISGAGQPRHPLMLRADAPLQPWSLL
jgi:hypothetical protein